MSLTDWIPAPFLTPGPWDLAWWQWIAISILVLASVLFGRFARWLFSWGLRKVVRRTETTLDDDLVTQLAGPLRLLGTILVFRVAMPLLELPEDRGETITDILLAMLAIGIVWGALRAIDVIISHASKATWVSMRPTSRSLLSLVARILKVVVVVIAVISFLGAIGLPIASLLAGLGIGGIALAFGAQKTVENLFGAFSLGIDQPLREGDFVKIEPDVTGTVESIGLRSTRLRTLDRTVVTVPNGKLADMRIETFGVRDRIRFANVIGVVYGTTSAQLRQVMDGFERVLREQKQLFNNEVTVRFMAFGQSSLDIEVMCAFVVVDYAEFRKVREQVLLGFMEVIETAGSSLAFPTQTVHLVSAAGPANKVVDQLARDR
jgi:MscS family membrane protein